MRSNTAWSGSATARDNIAYRNFLLRRIDGGAASSSAHSMPINSGKWAPSPALAALSEAYSWSSSRDLRRNNGSLIRSISCAQSRVILSVLSDLPSMHTHLLECIASLTTAKHQLHY